MKVLELISQLKSQKMTTEKILFHLQNQYQIHNKTNGTLVILDYDHIESVKDCDVTRECRGLVLDSQLNLVARSFKRFFNCGELKEDDRKFNWDNKVLCTEKVDGTLINLFFHNGTWKITTRFSFADSEVNGHGITWTELFLSAFDKSLLDYLDTSYNYVFELCSESNRIVRYYDKPQVFLLTVFCGETELNFDATKAIAYELGVNTPNTYDCSDIFDVQHMLTNIVINDKTFEGFVVRDCFNNRLKIKSEMYVMLHKRISKSGFTNVDLLKCYFDDGGSELTAIFPELRNRLTSIVFKYRVFRDKVIKIYESLMSENLSQKDYAIKALKYDFSSVLFYLRKGQNIDNICKESLDRVISWIE